MNILSLDLSTKSSGWAYFEDGILKDHGCITSSSTDLIKRIYIRLCICTGKFTQFFILCDNSST